jgi:hypothetical protein
MEQKTMIGTGDEKRCLTPARTESTQNHGIGVLTAGGDELRLRAQRLSLREQMERNHFLLERLNASSARLIQSLEIGDAFEAVSEIIANLIGSEELAIFHYCAATHDFDLLQRTASGAGMLGRAMQQATSQFRDRQPQDLLLPYEKNITACIALKSGQQPIGAIAIFELLPQKLQLEWADFELLKFLEIYGAVAIEFQRLQKKLVAL